MKDEENKLPTAPVELDDDDLEDVAGGFNMPVSRAAANNPRDDKEQRPHYTMFQPMR